MTDEMDKDIFDEYVRSGIIENMWSAYQVGIGVGKATERNKDMTAE